MHGAKRKNIINIALKKECFPVMGSPTIYFGGFSGVLAVDSVHFEHENMAKNGSPQRGSVRIFSFFTGVGTLCSHAAGWKGGVSYGWIIYKDCEKFSRMGEKIKQLGILCLKCRGQNQHGEGKSYISRPHPSIP